MSTACTSGSRSAGLSSARRAGVVAALVGCVALAACAARTHRGLEEARIDYLRATNDAELKSKAPQQLADAGRTLRQAEELWDEGGDRREVDHLVYMAERQIELARAQAEYEEARADVERLSERRRSATGGRESILSGEPHAVTVTAWAAPDGTVRGTVSNHASDAVRNVRLMIRYAWMWADEMHPGDYNPGRTEYTELDEEIAPGGSASFAYSPVAPLPRRGDGRFEVSVDVARFEEVPR